MVLIDVIGLSKYDTNTFNKLGLGQNDENFRKIEKNQIFEKCEIFENFAPHAIWAKINQELS